MASPSPTVPHNVAGGSCTGRERCSRRRLGLCCRARYPGPAQRGRSTGGGERDHHRHRGLLCMLARRISASADDSLRVKLLSLPSRGRRLQ